MNRPEDVSAEAWEIADVAYDFDLAVSASYVDAREAIARAIDAAIAKERERCVSIIKPYTTAKWKLSLRNIAAKIIAEIRSVSTANKGE